MTTTTAAVVVIIAIFVIGGLIGAALYTKGDVRAGAKIGSGTFFIEASDKRDHKP